MQFRFLKNSQEGGIGVFGFADFAPIFDSVFRFSLLNIAVFRFWCVVRFAGFQFNLWFSVFVKNDGGFSDSSAQFILRFSGFAKEVTHILQSR